MVTTSSSTCSVCEQEAHGLHFGAPACRPCAAFFRRTVFLDRRYKCKVTGECRIANDVRVLCSKCRYDKCLDVGMTTKNVQFNRDRISNAVKMVDSKPRPKEDKKSCDPPRPSIPTTFESMKPAECPPKDADGRMIIDVTETTSRIMDVLENFTPGIDVADHTELKKMCIATDRMHAQQWKNPRILSVLDLKLLGIKWEDQLLKSTYWMMHCEQFAELPIDEKKLIFKEKWSSLQRFDSCMRSLQIFGEETFSDFKVCLFDGYAVSKATLFDMSGVSNDMERLKNTFIPFVERMLRDVCRPAFELKLTSEEHAFMMCHILWSIEHSDVSEPTKHVADVYRGKLSNDLHRHYISKMKIANYSERLIKIMEILHQNEKIQRDRSKMVEMARFFDLFRLNITSTDVLDFENC